MRQSLVRRRASDLLHRAAAVILDAGAGVRLSGRYTPSRATPRGLAVVLHGWEGGDDSNYVLDTGARLLAEGWDVFRLNLRDHGGSHALNRGIFHSCRIDEVVGALAAIAARYPVRPLTLVGFSLGGNFALRVALRAPAAGLPLAAVLAVCPVIDPAHTLRAMERGHLYHRYFLHKWRRSLRRKQALFPDLDLLHPGDRRLNLRELTRVMTERQTRFGSLENYLDGYSIAGHRLAGLRVPARILTAHDDPVIPIADFGGLPELDCLQVDVATHGGHCGFIEDWRLDGYCPGYAAAWLGGFAGSTASERGKTTA
ncbi:MAG TPA: alpha/beta fold hydrolase [Rhodanobacteraceae bacterium]|nr:alpha/beta fold hydrolase [Rhodanobacteraceae bacterium]